MAPSLPPPSDTMRGNIQDMQIPRSSSVRGEGGERRKKKRARGGTGAYVAFAYTTRPCMLVCIRAAKFAFSRQKTITIAGERGGREGGRMDPSGRGAGEKGCERGNNILRAAIKRC